MSDPRRTVLFSAHKSLNARIVEFAGWEMPVQYMGVIAESRAVRESAGMFDVSHMGRAWFRGERVREFLELVTTNDIAKMEDGGSHYSLLCYPNGTCVDDVMVYRVSGGVFRMVINAANREKDLEWMRSQNRHDVVIAEETFETVMIAVQGPKASEIVQGISEEKILETERFHTVQCTTAGAPAFAARTGYTGEDGFELILPTDHAEEVWQALLDAGVTPCGLAARDVLRVEAGLPLYGNELSDKINPIESGLGWVCSKGKEFIGSEEINRMREDGPPRKLVGIRMETKIVPREGYPVLRDGARIGTVSSGVYSPTFECGIAFAFVETEHAKLKQPCSVEIRGKPHPAMVVSKRFMKGR
ncbi:MAG: glycine cleavage system aminomethyltransferase GcvT [Armatimonadetes bacterium]|nr:glycine cleavage system aminomethyltransferase GcvT [Armatimonadota bacterium]